MSELPEATARTIADAKALMAKYRPHYVEIMREPDSSERDDKVNDLLEEMEGFTKYDTSGSLQPTTRDHLELILLGFPIRSVRCRAIHNTLMSRSRGYPTGVSLAEFWLVAIPAEAVLERLTIVMRKVEARHGELLALARDEAVAPQRARSESAA
jgi:hypothetical protein